ncbi:hypothetical protein JCM4814A_68700 [Streptomyces phaeofaciens JCM 4814]|uniref:Lipoprotein n=1 Tax=Streptomyces phaeofaciens TaxID=68254 RepID=A0A918H6D2_9ACTN|nr:hypothetical protein [Streptomyces phaeofaciens]GGT41449.1 hypothetical protein GCM10010226_17350 [Streptomyces phaeofaciens]
MHDRRWAGCAGALFALFLAGCQAPAEERLPAGPSGSAPVAAGSGFGTVFLGAGECSSFGTTRFTEVPCGGERAAARVVARHDGTAGQGPPCPPATDFVLHIGAQAAGDGTAAVPPGYACMRNLQPPHPGDPGAGGGPRTTVGDCVYDVGGGQVRETACDGSGVRAPQYKVVRAVAARAKCPASTALYVQLGGPDPVGCARPV